MDGSGVRCRSRNIGPPTASVATDRHLPLASPGMAKIGDSLTLPLPMLVSLRLQCRHTNSCSSDTCLHTQTFPSVRPHVVDPLSLNGIHAHNLVHESNSWDLNRFAYTCLRVLIQPPHPYLYVHLQLLPRRRSLENLDTHGLSGLIFKRHVNPSARPAPSAITRGEWGARGEIAPVVPPFASRMECQVWLCGRPRFLGFRGQCLYSGADTPPPPLGTRV